MPYWSHHLFDTHDPGLCSTSRNKSRIGQVTMYCATLFWCLEIYASVSSRNTTLMASSKGGSPRSLWITATFSSPWSITSPCYGNPQVPSWKMNCKIPKNKLCVEIISLYKIILKGKKPIIEKLYKLQYHDGLVWDNKILLQKVRMITILVVNMWLTRYLWSI